ncbi:uncharacterized protein [Miscanthus floridulus]|uniref:uncharacterized protein n=1 Tax=Miscanthus floridulus TaxID=154761 RepID=UPI0034594F1A
MIADTSVESPEPIQPDIISASSAVPSPQIEPALSYSFNFEEYIDEDKISSSAISSKEALSEETKNRLKDMLSMLKKDIADLVQDVDPMRRTFLSIKGNLPLNLAEVLTPLSNIEDQAPRIEPELNQLRAKHAKLEKELENVKATINRHESNLAQIPDAIKQKREEMLTKVKEGKAIRSNLENIPGSAEKDRQQIAKVDAIRLKALKAIQDVLNL